MKKLAIKLGIGLLVATFAIFIVPALLTTEDESWSEDTFSTPPLGDPMSVQIAYRSWLEAFERNGGDRNLVMSLGWSKGLSSEHTQANGIARFDLLSGMVRVSVDGLADEDVADVWLVDNQPEPKDTVAPEAHDRYISLGRLRREATDARLEAFLGREAFLDFDVDLVVAKKDQHPSVGGGVLFGSPDLFHRLYRQEEREKLGLSRSADATPVADASPRPGLLELLSLAIAPRPVFAGHDEGSLINRGRELFFNEQFSGNGRTCGTCHPASNNLTIDATFISTLPDRDALFVAEFIPALATGFENPRLMRKVGLILENVDGFHNPGVMRGVPHTLAMGGALGSLTPAPDGTTIPPNQRTGWGGDGAPNSGTLRDFATGAVTQHFPLTLGRQNGVDFVLPNDPQLDAMAAFQLSLGRQTELDLRSMVFKNEVVARGNVIFNNAGGLIPALTVPGVAAGKCFFCHLNAGATDFFFPGQNANFNTGVEDLPDQPADLIDPAGNPPDGGFGQTPNPVDPNDPNSPIEFGNGSFNTPPIVEAADSGPFFPNNAIETVEESVNFYNSDAFNAAFGAAIGGIDLEATEVVAVAAMLRVINALENIRAASAEIGRALTAATLADARPHIQQAIDETGDAIEVLRCGRLHPRAVRSLVEADALLVRASLTVNRTARNATLNQANSKLREARGDMITP